MSMMEQVHLGGEDEEDIYGGFNDYNATLDTDVRVKCFLNKYPAFMFTIYFLFIPVFFLSGIGINKLLDL